MTIKQSPTIFIGLGGHGGKIVNNIAEKVQRRADFDSIQNLNHFMIIDTDQGDLNNRQYVSTDAKFCISNFNKFEYQLRKFGRKHDSPDPKITTWCPEPEQYSFRATSGAGAGQIRLESRLGVYYNLERGIGIQKKILDFIDKSVQTEETNLDDRRMVRVFIFGSIAGGTGSGSFLMMSYLAQALCSNSWTPKVSFVLSLPTLFKDKVGSNYASVCRNGYAALKELEFLTRKMGYEVSPEIDFRFSPNVAHSTRIKTAPSALTYLVDRPTGISIENIENAIADAVYLLVYTPMLIKVEQDLDNYEKSQRSLVGGAAFSTRYGVFGTHVIQFPREDIINYAVRRKLAAILKENLAFSGRYVDSQGTTVNFSVDYDDPKFKRQSEDVQNKDVDQKFLSYINYRVQEEERDSIKGMFTAIRGPKVVRQVSDDEDDEDESVLPAGVTGPVLASGSGASLWDKFFSLTEDTMRMAENQIDKIISTLEESQVPASAPSMTKHEANLRQELAQCSELLRTEADANIKDIRSGNFFNRLFAENKVNPIAQRFFLIHLLNMKDGGESKSLFIPPRMRGYPELIRTQEYPESYEDDVKNWNKTLGQVSNQSFFQKMTDRENKGFKSKRRHFVSDFNDMYVEKSRKMLRSDFWKSLEKELRSAAAKLAGTFRQVSKTADERVREELENSRRFMENPSSVAPKAQTALYEINAEALRDDPNKTRLWDCFYVDKFSDVPLDSDEINREIVDGFSNIEEGGRTRTPDANEVVVRIKSNLQKFLHDRYKSYLNQMHMNVEQALILEARYIAAKKSTHKPGEPDSKQIDIFAEDFPRHERTVILEKVSSNDVEQLLREKLSRVARECDVMANIDESLKSSGELNIVEQLFFSIDSQITRAGQSDQKISLATLVREIIGADTTEDLGDPDQAIFYKSTYNIPLFSLNNIAGEMEQYYKEIRTAQVGAREDGNWTGYIPNHIEWSWEIDQVPLIDLNPMEMKSAKEHRERLDKVQKYFLCFYFDKFHVDEDGVSFTVYGDKNILAEDREKGFRLFHAPDQQIWTSVLKKDYVKEVETLWRESTLERRLVPTVISRLEGHLEEAKKEHYLAHKDKRDSLALYFNDERELIESLISALQMKL